MQPGKWNFRKICNVEVTGNLPGSGLNVAEAEYSAGTDEGAAGQGGRQVDLQVDLQGGRQVGPQGGLQGVVPGGA